MNRHCPSDTKKPAIKALAIAFIPLLCMLLFAFASTFLLLFGVTIANTLGFTAIPFSIGSITLVGNVQILLAAAIAAVLIGLCVACIFAIRLLIAVIEK